MISKDTPATANRDFLDEMLEAGKKWDSRPKPEPARPKVKSKPESEPNSSRAFLEEMLKAGKKYSDGPIRPEHNKPDTKKWTDEQKIEACPHNNGRGYTRGVKKANIRKMPDGDTRITPRYCNMCEGCYRHHAKELKEKMEYIDALAKHKTKDSGGGHWRKAAVEDDKEAKALKKKASRNQESRHVEFAADKPGHNEVWTYVDNDEPEPEKYGEIGDLEQDIDFDKVYKNNRETGKKFSTGKAFKSSAPPNNQDTIRIIIPEVVVDMADADKAEKIMRETNYIEEAETAKDAQRAYAHEFKHVITELEKEGIEVLAVDHTYYNITPDRLLEEWNRSRKWWVSINASLPLESSDAKRDIRNRLYYPDNKKEPQEEVLS